VPIAPILTSSIDFSHKKPVSEILWLPQGTEINHRGNLVSDEHLDGSINQLVTISGDGSVFVWDTRFEKIAAEELKHIARPKHVPLEKSSAKGEEPKLLWAPIFRAPLKRTEGIGEISLNKVCCSGNLPSKLLTSKGSELPGDPRSHLILGTEEGEVLFVDLCATPAGGAGHHDDEDDGKEGSSREFIRWCKMDHSRPPVSIQQSPFFPDIVLSVSDWAFHIWQVGKDKPIYVSTNHSHYLTGGSWSPTRPAVVILTDTTGHLQIWDFTDTSTRPSAELKATHEKITSMEFMDKPEKANINQQLLAIGDEFGTLHVYEMPPI
jgi:WD40 repeat protein